jgi:tetratricopeptide (TPR) repeat protein
MKRILYLLTAMMICSAGNAQPYNNRAVEYFQMGCEMIARNNFRVAINDFTEALNYDPWLKQAYENRGVAKFYLQDMEGAIEDYSKALEMDPYDYSTYGRRGWAKYMIKDYNGAIADLTFAIRGVKYIDKYHNMRGEVKYRLGDFEGATADFTWVIKSNGSERPEKAKAYFWRGIIGIELGQKENACTDLHKAARKGFKKAWEILQAYCE